MKIYLVEDSVMVRERLAKLLSEVPGASIVGHAGGAAQAVSGILETRPDLVVLDVQLAEGSGFDVLRELHARAPELDVYMLTNYSADPYRQIAGRFGARKFFDKTREFERVRDAVAERAARLF
jgi:DNA-binding NarL/FixJ family response regulator